MLFGLDIGKAFGKKRIHTAASIKDVFAHTIRDFGIYIIYIQNQIILSNYMGGYNTHLTNIFQY